MGETITFMLTFIAAVLGWSTVQTASVLVPVLIKDGPEMRARALEARMRRETPVLEPIPAKVPVRTLASFCLFAVFGWLFWLCEDL